MSESFARIRHWVDARPGRVAVGLSAFVVLAGLLKYGISVRGSWELLLEVAVNWRDPMANGYIPEGQAWILGSPVAAVLSGVLGLNDPTTYISGQVVLACAAISIPFLMPTLRSAAGSSRLLAVLLIGGPLVPVLLNSIGGYDAITVIGFALAVLSRSAGVAAVGWFLAAANHPLLALIALVIWLPSAWLSAIGIPTSTMRRHLLPAGIGTSVGWFVNNQLMVWWEVPLSRGDVRYPFDYYLSQLQLYFPLSLFVVLGVGWIIFLDPSLRQIPLVKYLLGASLVAGIAFPLIGSDITRLAAVGMYPALLQWIRVSEPTVGVTECRRLWSRYVVTSLVIPVPMLFGSGIYLTGWQGFLYWSASLQ